MSAPHVHYGTTPDNDAFAVVRYGAATSDVKLVDDRLHIDIAIPVLGCSRGKVEIWSSDKPLQRDLDGPAHLRFNDNLLFGAMRLDGEEQLEQASRQAYQTILGLLAERSFPAPLRMWNYFPRIVEHDADGERYQLFCSGRHSAFNTTSGYEPHLPAASALGSHGPGAVVYFLAARTHGLQVENPGQMSAFHYPRQYGPRSPSFSRAVIKSWGHTTHFYLSGTASIRGHKSLHHGDGQAQLQLTLENIEHLLEHSRTVCPDAPIGLTALHLLKVYVRHKDDYPQVRAELERRLGVEHPVLYLLADVCRAELLVEIEGIGIS